MSLAEFEDLLDWFERKDDEFFIEKEPAQLRRLKNFFEAYTPCDNGYIQWRPAYNHSRALMAVQRAVKIKPCSVKAWYMTPCRLCQPSAIPRRIPVRHSSNCCCAVIDPEDCIIPKVQKQPKFSFNIFACTHTHVDT